MTPKDKRDNFEKELKELLDKYKAEIIIGDFGSGYSTNPKIVVDFEYDESLFVIGNEIGLIPQLIIGTYINGY